MTETKESGDNAALDHEAVRRQFVRRTGGMDALRLKDFKLLLVAVLKEHGDVAGKLPSNTDLEAAFKTVDANKSGSVDEDEVNILTYRDD